MKNTNRITKVMYRNINICVVWIYVQRGEVRALEKAFLIFFLLYFSLSITISFNPSLYQFFSFKFSL